MSFQKSVYTLPSARSLGLTSRNLPPTHFIAISPEEVPRPDILVRILDSLFQRWQVAPVLPMFVPQIPSVDAGEYEAWNDHAAEA